MQSLLCNIHTNLCLNLNITAKLVYIMLSKSFKLYIHDLAQKLKHFDLKNSIRY